MPSEPEFIQIIQLTTTVKINCKKGYVPDYFMARNSYPVNTLQNATVFLRVSSRVKLLAGD